MLRFVRLTEEASVPSFGSPGAAGADLCCAVECVIPAKGMLDFSHEYLLLALGKCLISTGLQIALPPGHYGRIAPRSGLASKHFIDVGAGVIDEDYRGEIKVLLFNFGENDFHVKVGARIAQLICECITRPVLKEVTSLDETKRGSSGFGSTGI
jgi:dUTP pyrophosphatase